jgi:hypothetical protein
LFFFVAEEANKGKTGNPNWREEGFVHLTSVRLAAYDMAKIVYFFYETNYSNGEGNCAEPSPSIWKDLSLASLVSNLRHERNAFKFLPFRVEPSLTSKY